MRRGAMAIWALVLAVVVVLGGVSAMGLTSGQGVTLAQTEAAPQPPTLLARMAKTLSIEEQALKDAIAQAQRELEAEALTKRLQKMVENGQVTQEQADRNLEWYRARPLLPALGRPFFGLKGGFFPPQPLLARAAKILGIDEQALNSAFLQAQREMEIEALARRLQGMVEKGQVTQEQADRYLEWYRARPNMPPLGPGFGFWGMKRLRHR